MDRFLVPEPKEPLGKPAGFPGGETSFGWANFADTFGFTPMDLYLSNSLHTG